MAKKKSTTRDEARPHDPARVERLRKFYERNESFKKTPWSKTEEIPDGEKEMDQIVVHYIRGGNKDEK